MGWLFGGNAEAVTKKDLEDAMNALGAQANTLEERNQADRVLRDGVTAHLVRQLNFLDNLCRGILVQVNTFALQQGLRI